MSRLDVISTQFLLVLWLLVAIALGLLAHMLRRLRPFRPVRLAAAVVVALVTITVATADTVNAHFAYLPTVSDLQAAVTGDRQWLPVHQLASLSDEQREGAVAAGTTVRMTLPADAADGFAASALVAYLPPQYFTEPSAHFPVVYLFHGSPGRPADWFHGGDAATVGLQSARNGWPAIFLAPQLSRSWTDDSECVNGARERVESHLVSAVIPAVDRLFRTIPNRFSRVFAGMSAGGYCALNLGLRHRDLTATIIDMSGLNEPTHTGGAAVLFGKHNPAANRLIAENSPAMYASRLTADPPTRVWLDTGSGDTTIVREMATLAVALTERGITVRWRERSGGHTFWAWTAALQESAPWALGAPPGRPTHNPSRPGVTAGVVAQSSTPGPGHDRPRGQHRR